MSLSLIPFTQLTLTASQVLGPLRRGAWKRKRYFRLRLWKGHREYSASHGVSVRGSLFTIYCTHSFSHGALAECHASFRFFVAIVQLYILPVMRFFRMYYLMSEETIGLLSLKQAAHREIFVHVSQFAWVRRMYVQLVQSFRLCQPVLHPRSKSLQ